MSHESQSQIKTHREITSWDRAGVILSTLCLVHCLAIPFLILSLPILARYYLLHPYFHWIMAIAILPVGFFAFFRGFQHHRQIWIVIAGLTGLFLVGVTPILFDFLQVRNYEPLFVSVGSAFLILAHWKNQRACACEHSH